MTRLALAATMLVAACGGTPKDANEPKLGADEELICRDETPTGSNISRTVCRTRQKAVDDRQDTQRDLQKPRPAPWLKE
jgi:hypothetical protein